MKPSSEAVSPLRQRMVEDMRMRKLEPKTRTAYIRAVRRLATFLQRSPDTATVEDLRRFQLYLVDQGTSPITLNATITGLKFFFDVTLGRSELMARMQTVRVPQKQPVVLSRDEVTRLALQDARVFAKWLKPLRHCEWVVYAKRPFAGPQAVLAYLSRYTHRVTISNSRLVAMDERGVTFRWKDYRAKGDAQGKVRHKTMTLAPQEFMRRFLLHVLPGGFHRIRHYGLLANGNRRDALAMVRTALQAKVELPSREPLPRAPTFVCRHCGQPLLIVELVMRERPSIRAPPS